MSCFVVSDDHISSLIATAIYGPTDTVEANQLGRFHRHTFGRPREILDICNATKLGRKLLEVNVRGVQLHDSSGERGDSSFYENYSFPNSPVFVGRARRLTVVQALKALQCFEYQCDNALDEALPAAKEVKEVIDDLRRNLIQVLPGYEEAKWEL